MSASPPATENHCATCGRPLRGGGPCARCVARVTLLGAADDHDAGDDLGCYEVMDLLGRGGSGKVYRARHRLSGDLVALKVLSSGLLSTEKAWGRFLAEARLAQRLNHPGIVRIWEVSAEDDPEPWMAMELVGGPTLAEKLRGQSSASTRQLVTWLAEVAEAVAAAHAQGVLHRDLKPSNVLLGEDGRARLADFGLGCLLEEDSAMLTRTGEVLGTPAFMAPEQALGRMGAATTATDVYGLGALLYHALTGRAPFTADSVPALLHAVVHRDPVPPSRLNASTPRGLEALCLRCLEKEPARRPAGAAFVAQELRCFLAGRALQTRPLGLVERSWRWTRRNRRESVLLAALAASILMGAGLVAHHWRQAVNARDTALLENYATDLREASFALEEGDVVRARRLLDSWRPAHGEPDLRGLEWRLLHQQSHSPALHQFSPAHPGAINQILPLPDGKHLLTLCQQGAPRVWDLESRLWVTEILGVGLHHESAVLGPDGKTVWLAEPETLKIWEVDLRSFAARQSPGAWRGRHLALSPDKRWLATSTADPWNLQKGGEVLVWEASTGTRVEAFRARGRDAIFSPDNRFMAVAGPRHGVKIYSTATWREAMPELLTEGHAHSLAFEPGGNTLAASGFQGTVWLWDLDAKPPSRRELGPGLPRNGQVVFAPTGGWAYGAGADRLVHLWDWQNGVEAGRFSGHGGEVWSVALSLDGKQVFSGGKDNQLLLWEAGPPGVRAGRFGSGETLTSPLVVPGTPWAVVRETGRPPLKVDTRALTATPLPGRSENLVAALPGGILVYRNPTTDTLEYRSITDQALQRELRLAELPPGTWGDTRVQDHVSSGLGGVLALFCEKEAWVVDLKKGRLIARVEEPAAEASYEAVSEDGRWLAMALGKTIRLHDLSDGSLPPREIETGFYGFHHMAFSPDDRLLAASNEDALVRVYESATGRLVHEFHGHPMDSMDVAFSPDGRTLASIGSNEGVRLWRLDSGREVARLPDRKAGAFVRIAQDGRTLLYESGRQIKVLPLGDGR